MNPVPLLQDYLIDSAHRLPEKVALVYRGERLTYADLDRRSNALANALHRRGVRRGDRVVVFGSNSPEVVVGFWGALKANAVVSIVNPLTKADKLAYMLNDCGAVALIAEAQLAAIFVDSVREAASLRSVLVYGPGANAPALGDVGRFEQLDAAAAAEAGDRAPSRACIDIDLAALIYTSGSTGEPKGVMLTHRNMLTAATSISGYLDVQEDEVILGVLPLAFDYGLYQMIMAFRQGARLVLDRSFAFPAQVLKLVVDEGVTGFPGVPTMFATMGEMESLKQFDFSRIRYATNTAAALHVKHILMLKDIFPRARIYSMYGLTECKRCTYLPPKDLDRKPTSVGIAIPNTELWLVDEAGNRLGPDQVGQLVIRGATVMRGYWGKPEETARKLRPGTLPGELVLYTGNLCRLDQEGYLYFVGRMDDIIKSRGEKVAPKEVEDVLVGIPGVKEAAVIGVPDEILGHAIKAFVVPHAGVRLDEREIRKACQSKLEAFMVPKYIVFVPELAKGDTGKIKKTGLS